MKYKKALSYENPPAIVLGGGGNGLGIVRSLGRRGIYTIVITDNVRHSTMDSRFIGEKIHFQGSDDALVEMLLDNPKLHHYKPVLFPIRDATVAAMIKRFEALNEKFRIGMNRPNVIKKALCKTSFNIMASKMGFLTAKTYSIDSLNGLNTILEEITFPCILKPELRGNQFLKHSSAKAFHAITAQQLITYYKEFAGSSPEAVVQEFIPGKESDLFFCFQYYDRNSRPLLSLNGKKIRQWPPKCGSTSSCEVIESKAIEDLSTLFFQKIGYFGPCSMEIKKNEQTGEYYLIEATIGRTDWNNSFAEGNGLPIPFIMYCDIIGRSNPNFRPKKISRKWIRWSADYKAAMHQIKNKELSWFDWFKSVIPPNVGPIWSIDDPAPFFMPYIKSFTMKLFKK
jgi:predicted ATP-grasp superfamily ATP-dependent carboligase